ncbi:MAG: hypothetical protein F6K22_32915 [Okeania sp. SIO2F4]|nr:hypothetical protein [Okeania sp. SIO2F4]
MVDTFLSIFVSIFFIVLTLTFTLISGFNLIYPVVDLFSHELLSLNFYQQELISGQFGLRIVSLILGMKTISALLDFVYQKSNIKTGYPELDNLSVNHPTSKVTAFVLGQLFIYQLATFSLWLSNLFLGFLLETKLISWALFFVVDDWAIISDYYKALKGRFFTSHLIRITFFNFLFCVVLPITFYKYFNWWTGLITFASIAILSTMSLG